MAEREIVKRYQNGDFTVVWKPKLCIHAKTCIKTLPEVYNPNEKPWIKAENASIEALKSQISQCPSGALSYELEGEKELDSPKLETKIQVMTNGPLLVHGHLEVTGTDNTVEKKHVTTAFCRCGASSNKPYCDGTHNSIQFQG
jgi:uncharacterized Fe-S cluster protein YjdI